VAETARHFGVSRRTLLTWRKRFDAANLLTLEDRSRAPKHERTWQVTSEEEVRILTLKRRCPRWGKAKIQVLYLRAHGVRISQWKIQRVVTKHQCFPEPVRVAKRARKRKRTGALGRRKRIQELVIRREPHFLVQVDTVVRYIAGTKRYIFTAIDHVTKLAYARMYASGSSQGAADFLQRLWILFGARIQNLQTDNGSEFAGAFADACRELGVERYFSRVKIPKDNAVEERFNETLDLEFLRDGNLDSDVQRFNAKLAPWLVEYNTIRPHATLSYLTPLEFLERHRRGRMWSSTTWYCANARAGVSQKRLQTSSFQSAQSAHGPAQLRPRSVDTGLVDAISER
jgi:transposase InsO family protein